MKAVPGDAIGTENGRDTGEAEAAGGPVFRKNAAGEVVGYQYHPPRKSLKEKLREIVRILKE